jgi:hypothetical protein
MRKGNRHKNKGLEEVSPWKGTTSIMLSRGD